MKSACVVVAAVAMLVVLVWGCHKLFAVGFMLFMTPDSSTGALGIAVMSLSIGIVPIGFLTVAQEILKQFNFD